MSLILPDLEDKHLQGSDKPLVTIGMPIFNAQNYLRESLEALLNQTFSNFELIISDNASTDNTEAICREYAKQDSRIQYYRNPKNEGGAKNFNLVFERARGDYFKWAAYDDLCAPDYIEQCLEVLEREPSVVLCYPQAKEIDADGNEVSLYTENLNLYSSKPHERFYQLLETYGWYHATQIFGLVRTEVLKRTQMMGNYPHADRVLLAELAICGQFHEVPEILFFRRIHPQNSQQSNKTDEELAINWFDPNNRGKLLLPRWRRYIEYCRLVWRTPLSGGERLKCYVQILRRLLLSPGFPIRIRGMVEELRKAMKLLPHFLAGLSNEQTTPHK
ncbi:MULTISPECIES: glycosyltransferase family 2 protein [unclassified Coleofasciculus]|uniref:glycosyltransferase family 2 protein n=1 Tax=unclassified Coleofasciculus TaxID=2692782 RepID=UPI00187E1563|nr:MULTISPECIES: glycosyltransferase family 2 protein [unclassified Coleofasciculus]MBE9125732.1 glycosyltransferase family 2 protein [Coleofasciculus sp. LEGE 07081]MBE9147220.1 glycosyltransferase family 2 protein [Coleofasciculus sp. LEGE 07092]